METDIYGEDASVGNFGFNMAGECRTFSFGAGRDADREDDSGSAPGTRIIVFEDYSKGYCGDPLGSILILPDGRMEFYDGMPGGEPIFVSSIGYLKLGSRAREWFSDLIWPLKRRLLRK